MEFLIKKKLRLTAQQDEEYKLISNFNIEWDEYRTLYDLSSNTDPVVHFILNWKKLQPTIPAVLDTAYYLLNNTDVKEIGINPLVHFLLYGRPEGRLGFSHSDDSVQQSEQLPETGMTTGIESSEIVPAISADNEKKSSSEAPHHKIEMVKDIPHQPTENVLQQLNIEKAPSFNVNREDTSTIPVDSDISTIKSKHNSHLSVEELHAYGILQSANLAWDTYIQTYIHDTENVDPIEHYIKHWKKSKIEIKNFFDSVYYLKKYNDIASSEQNPLVHFIAHGKSEGRLGCYEEEEQRLNNAEQFEFDTLSTVNIDWGKYFESNNIADYKQSPLHHYIKNWKKRNDLIVPNCFDTELYLELYPDIKKSKVNPLSHYLLHGKSEGRVGLFEIEKHGKEGKQAFNSNKESIVVVSHESSATGAPLVGLNIGNELSKKYNIIHYILRESDLHEDFSERSCMVITDLKHRVFLISVKILQWLEQKYKIKSIICNSVETIDILQAANKLCIPSISLIHEFADYTRPVGKITNTVMMADKVVVPANIILDSLKRELKKTCNISITPNNISVYPQGKLPYIPAGHGKSLTAEQLRSKLKLERDTKLIVGAGFAQIRKGVDLFVDTAIKIKKKYKGKCKFVWVGSGYKPETDLAYSVWIEPHIENASMQDDIVFLEHQSSLDPILSITDVFCLTSRLDPFPNVVIDALQADVHVACFDKSTGCAEFLNRNRSNSSIAGYLDTEDLSNKIVSYIKQKNSQRGINKRLVAEKLDFSKYVQFIERCIDEARAFRDKSQSIDQFLSETHEFDSDYNDHNNKETAQKYYVERCLKGIHIRNPKPGFSDLEWISNEENGNYFTVPLYNALKKQISSTHKSVLLKDDTKGTSKLKSAQMYAVHLHLFYTDLASEFSDYFSNLPGNFDLFITVLDGEDIDAVKEKFKLCGARDTKVISVKNIGRDIAPLIIDLKEEITSGNYAFIGHFHSKKSLEVGGGLGDRWRKYLMNNLIGTEATAQQVLSLFNDNQIGLIFADDYHISDFGTNKVFADKICSDIGLPSMEHAFIFPLGTMFWARPQILLPLFESNFSTYLQQEPLPYDGSFMHAIERLIPHLCESSGYSYLTVYTENNYW